MITTSSTPFKIIPTDKVFTPNKLFYLIGMLKTFQNIRF